MVLNWNGDAKTPLQLNGAHGVNSVLVMSLVAMVLINEHENA